MELKVRPKETDDSQVPKKVLNETISKVLIHNKWAD